MGEVAMHSEQQTVITRSNRKPRVVIAPSHGWVAINFAELWAYRDLLWLLAGRDVKLRYKQTALGVIWVVLQPIVAALLFAVIFGRFAKLPSDGLPYPLFVFAGMLPWNYFAGTLQRAGNSLLTDARLISKVYFPRLLIPLASTSAVLIDFLVTLVVLLGLLFYYQIAPTWRLATVPFFLLITSLAGVGVSLWLSALNVRYRDFVYVLPFLTQLWMYASPVAYSTSIIPEKWQWLYSVNPAVGFIEGFRWSLLGQGTLTLLMVILSSVASAILFISGVYYFRRVERSFADVI